MAGAIVFIVMMAASYEQAVYGLQCIFIIMGFAFSIGVFLLVTAISVFIKAVIDAVF